MAITLTMKEQEALAVIQEESRGNGHDFAVIEQIRWGGDRRQLGALITSLQAKGVITEVAKPYKINDGETVTQLVLAKEYQA